jgi:hypothetical protein
MGSRKEVVFGIFYVSLDLGWGWGWWRGRGLEVEIYITALSYTGTYLDYIKELFDGS